ncbi:MAG: DUF934 domain-containing protein [Gammaproteobacteria bacterium]|nr:DUF934 domain-containing protein [Gammaproteobacteria bacterium]
MDNYIFADSKLDNLTGSLNRLKQITIPSIDFNDGRIFSLAREIRLRGYRGRLAVIGNLLPDQIPALLSCGFDSVEILDKNDTQELVNQNYIPPV